MESKKEVVSEFRESMRLTSHLLSTIGFHFSREEKMAKGWFRRNVVPATITILFYYGIGALAWYILGGNFESFSVAIAVISLDGYSFIGFFKKISLHANEAMLHDIVERLQTLWVEADNDPHIETIKKKFLRRIHLVNLGNAWFCRIMIIVYTLNVVYKMTWMYYKNGVFKPLLLYYLAYPYDKYSSTFYPITFIYETWVGYLAVFSVTASDAAFCVLTSHVCMFYKVLQYKLRMLMHDKEEFVKGTATNQLKELVKYHQILIRLCEDLCQIYTFSMLTNFFIISLMLCCSGFYAMVFEEAVVLDFKLVFTAGLLQILIVCYYGDMLLRMSSGVADSAYECNWTLADSSFRRLIYIIIQRSQKPLGFTKYRFCTVSMRGFASILSASWSYFTLLKSVHTDLTRSIQR